MLRPTSASSPDIAVVHTPLALSFDWTTLNCSTPITSRCRSVFPTTRLLLAGQDHLLIFGTGRVFGENLKISSLASDLLPRALRGKRSGAELSREVLPITSLLASAGSSRRVLTPPQLPSSEKGMIAAARIQTTRKFQASTLGSQPLSPLLPVRNGWIRSSKWTARPTQFTIGAC